MQNDNENSKNTSVRTTENGFPINQASFSGIIIGIKELKGGEAISFGVSQPKENFTGATVINVYVNGAANVKMFKDELEEFNKKKFKKQDSEQFLSPLVFVKGLASFSTYLKDEITNNTVSIIANEWTIPKTENELQQFRKTYNGKNPLQNELSIVGIIGRDVKISDKEGKEFSQISVAHNYKVGEEDNLESKTMWLNVYVPTKVVPQIKNLNLEKGSSINITGKLSPYIYENEKGKSKRVTVQASSISANMKKVIEQAKVTEKVQTFASESLEKVAHVNKQKERIEESEKAIDQIEKMTPKKPKIG